MAHVRKEEAKSKGDRLQTILRLVQEHPISRQEVLLDYLRKEGFDVTQATISRDIRELCLVKAATAEGYRYVSSRNESFNPKTQGRFETIFHESVLGVDYAGHVVLVKCYSGMANAACEVFDALQWKNVVGTLSGDDTFLIVARSERDAKTICTELTRMAIHCEETQDSITIYPGMPHPCTVATYDDHRMAMGFALTGLRAEGIVIDDPGCCRKTFENYFEVLDQVIAKIIEM